MAEFRENRDVRRPFLSTPDDRVYFPASIVEKARRDAERCLKRGEGVALVFGDAGVGKTLLARSIAANCDDDDLVALVSASRKFSVKAFLQQLLFALRQSFVGGDETELRLMTLDYLERAPQKRRILLVDDAQNLTIRVFDEIRMLVDRAEPPAQLSVALFGTRELEDRLNLPSLYPFAQRVVTRSWLDSFTSEETARFINAELKRAGVNAKFTKAAKKAVADLTDGAPRVVVQLCDRALFFATENPSADSDGKKTRHVEVDEDVVQAAWRDLQSIMEEETVDLKDSSDNVVEFGELDDDESNGYDEAGSAEKAEPEVVAKEENGVAKELAPTPQSASETLDLELASVDSGDGEPVAPRRAEAMTEERKRAAKAFWNQNDATIVNPEDAIEEDDATDVGEIDELLEARLLAKLDAQEASARSNKNEKESQNAFEPMNFEIVSENGESYQWTGNAAETLHDAPFVQHDASCTAQEQISNLWEKNGGFDEALRLDSAYPPVYEAPKGVTRRPIVEGDDGSDAYRAANGFDAEDVPFLASDDANLDAIFAQSPESDESDRVEELQDSLEDRAYRQIIASCYRSSNDFTSSDQYLRELRLLEQEIAEEANLIRRIRSIHLQLRAVREPKPADDAPKEDESRNRPGSFTS